MLVCSVREGTLGGLSILSPSQKRCPILRREATCAVHLPLHLLLEHFFKLADFLLDLASELFDFAFGLQAVIVRDLSRPLFGLAVHFVKLPWS